MREIFGIIIVLTLLASCTESFKSHNPKKFNLKIANRTDIKTPEELIKLYYRNSDKEGNSKLIIKADNLGDNNFQICLIDEELDDDSQSGEKIIMKAKLNGQIWNVTEIKENWKCGGGRGHSGWGTDECE